MRCVAFSLVLYGAGLFTGALLGFRAGQAFRWWKLWRAVRRRA